MRAHVLRQVTNSIHNMASADFGGFHGDFLYPFLHEATLLGDREKQALMDGFGPERDMPSFTAYVQVPSPHFPLPMHTHTGSAQTCTSTAGERGGRGEPGWLTGGGKAIRERFLLLRRQADRGRLRPALMRQRRWQTCKE